MALSANFTLLPQVYVHELISALLAPNSHCLLHTELRIEPVKRSILSVVSACGSLQICKKLRTSETPTTHLHPATVPSTSPIHQCFSRCRRRHRARFPTSQEARHLALEQAGTLRTADQTLPLPTSPGIPAATPQSDPEELTRTVQGSETSITPWRTVAVLLM
jgi:hypothetical protein